MISDRKIDPLTLLACICSLVYVTALVLIGFALQAEHVKRGRERAQCEALTCERGSPVYGKHDGSCLCLEVPR